MKQKKLSSLLAVTLSLELMVSPLIPAVQAQTTTTPPPTQAPTSGQRQESGFDKTMNGVSQGLQAIGGVWQAVNQARSQGQGAMTSQMAGDMAKMREQQTPQTDKYFNAQKLMQIPGLGEYLAMNNINPGMLDCKTLPTTLHDAKPEVCRIGVTNDRGVAQPAQLQQMFTYYNQYFQTSKMYKNFSADSNSDGQAFGIGCMNNAMNILNGFFKYRMNELDKLTTNLEAMQAQFEAASRADLDAIEEAVAVLDGDSEIADKVRSKKPDLFDFGKRFNDPACKSMFAGNSLDDKGKSGGLNAINRNVKDLLTTKQGKYSGESYAQSHAAVVEDIRSVANKIAKQFELNFTPNLAGGSYSELLKNISGSVSSTSGVADGIKLDHLADTQTKFMEQSTKLATERSTILSELKGADKAMALMGNLNSSASFEAEVASLENGIKNECLASSLGSADTLLSKIYDPTASKHANKNASNFLKDKLQQILSNEKTSPEKKLAELRSLEASEGNRFYMRMENSYEVQEVDANGNIKTTVIPASQNRSPSVFFSDVIKNCNAQFKANKLNNKLSGAQAIQKLRELNNSYKTLAQSQSADIKKELAKKLIECTSPEVANNTVPGSCQPGLFNPSTPGFCANAAFSCSKNMQACSTKAEGFVKEIRDQKTARLNNYKALVDKNKKDIIKIFDTALSKYMKDGEILRGMFGAGFSSPAGIKREVPEGQRYLSDFANSTGKQGSPDGKLLLEDPAKYTEMFKQNIDLLKRSVQAQQDQILGGESVGTGKNPGLLADHIKKTQKNYQDVIKEADKIAGDCLNQHDNAIKAAEAQRAQQAAEQQKKMSELGEKRDKFCNMYGMARTNPQAVCGGVTEDLIVSSSQAATIAGPNQAAARNNVSQLAAVCRQYGNNSTSSGSINAETLCADVDRTNQRFVTDATMKTTITNLCKERNSQRTACNTGLAQTQARTTPTPPAADATDETDENTRRDGRRSGRDCSAITEDFNSRIVAQYNLGPDVAEADVVLEDAPAYCTAGDNSGRESSMGGWGKTFADSLARAMGQAGSGQ